MAPAHELRGEIVQAEVGCQPGVWHELLPARQIQSAPVPGRNEVSVQRHRHDAIVLLKGVRQLRRVSIVVLADILIDPPADGGKGCYIPVLDDDRAFR